MGISNRLLFCAFAVVILSSYGYYHSIYIERWKNFFVCQTNHHGITYQQGDILILSDDVNSIGPDDYFVVAMEAKRDRIGFDQIMKAAPSLGGAKDTTTVDPWMLEWYKDPFGSHYPGKVGATRESVGWVGTSFIIGRVVESYKVDSTEATWIKLYAKWRAFHERYTSRWKLYYWHYFRDVNACLLGSCILIATMIFRWEKVLAKLCWCCDGVKQFWNRTTEEKRSAPPKRLKKKKLPVNDQNGASSGSF